MSQAKGDNSRSFFYKDPKRENMLLFPNSTSYPQMGRTKAIKRITGHSSTGLKDKRMTLQTIRTALWALVTIAAMAVIFVRYDNPSTSTTSSTISTGLPNTSLPGGAFTLTDHTGKIVTDTDFLGKYMLVYFGYSFCPDVCPLELQKITLALNALEQQGFNTEPIQPLFISVDPERDTVEELALYIPQFHENMLGLHGTPDQIAALAKAYKVYYRKVESPDMADYLVDHLNVLFLMGRDGQYKRIFTARDSLDDVVGALKLLLQENS